MKRRVPDPLSVLLVTLLLIAGVLGTWWFVANRGLPAPDVFVGWDAAWSWAIRSVLFAALSLGAVVYSIFIVLDESGRAALDER